MRKAALVSSGQGHQLYLAPSRLALLFLASFIVDGAQAQAPLPPITSSGLNTAVTTNGTMHDITGGTRPGGTSGTTLFHSFGDLSVPTNNIANFINAGSVDLNGNVLAPNLPTSNILGRVTGGDPSAIFGTIQTNGTGGFGNANFFLMNPNGFIFGPNANLNVGGLVAFTTADYLKLADDARFDAIPNAAADGLLTASPLVAFGFLGSNPAAIAVQGSRLTVANGTGLSFIGGDRGFTYSEPGTGTTASVSDGMTITESRLSAPSGQINIASVASAGEIVLTSLQSAPNINGQSFTTMGNITLSRGATLDVSENTAGTVRIRGGQFVMDQATISGDTVNANGAVVAIDIKVTNDLAIANVDIPALTARTAGSGDAGEIQVSSANLNAMATGVSNLLVSAIDTHTSGSGKAGAVNIATGDLMVTGDPSGASFVFFVNSGTSGPNTGPGGNVTINANQIQAQDTTLVSSGNFVDFLNEGAGAGTAGDVTINAKTLNLFLANIVTDSFDFVDGTGKAGSLTVTSPDITLEGSFFSSAGQERGGAIIVNTDTFRAIDGDIITQTNLLNGGPVNITGNIIEMATGSTVVSGTGGDGHAGSITIMAFDHLSLLAEPVTDNPAGTFNNPSGVFSNSFGTAGGTIGNAGDILIITPRLDMTNGSRVDTTTATSGHGGNVTIQTTNLISMSGETGAFAPESLFTLGALQPSGIYTRTVGGNCSGSCGNAGNVSVTTDSLSMGTGSQINSGTSSSGQGGSIFVSAGNAISMSGTLSSDQPGGIQSRSIGISPDAGTGGNIALTAGQFISVSDGAALSASSSGLGNAGNISINAGQQLDVQNGSITTRADQASGGNIDIRAIDRVRLVNGEISASVQGGPDTAGGNITIDPNVVVLQGTSKVTAQAVQGAGGNITIFTPLFLSDPTSLVDASSQFGLSGRVTIQSPTSNLSGTVKQLTSKPSETQALLQNRCVALAGGEQSTFIVSGRDALPSEPGAWLSSPIAMDHWIKEDSEHAARLMVNNVGLNELSASVHLAGPDVLSLRRLTPPGFLVRTFAIGPTGCPS